MRSADDPTAPFADSRYESGARLVVFDIIFSPPKDGDQAFRAALDKYREKVVLGANLDMANEGQAREMTRNESWILGGDSGATLALSSRQ